MDHSPILQVQDLSISYTPEGTNLPVLRNINLEIQKGQVYGLVGESGSGKTTLGLAVMRYLPSEGRVTGGTIKLNSNNLLTLPKTDLRDIWGKQTALVPQDPSASLNPSIRVGEQLAEIFLAHGELGKKAAALKTLEWFKRVRLPDPVRTARKYPHELSGGQKQRILIAMAFCNQPQLLILDEPTTNLDVTTEAVILDLLSDLIQVEGASALFITHNLGVVANRTDRVAVLYAGELVEDAPTKTLYQQPLHPYTHGLINSIPKLGMHKNERVLSGISGQIPPLSKLPTGCVFAPRCSVAIDLCHQERPLLDRVDKERSIRCHRWRELISGEIVLPTKDQQISPIQYPEPEPVLLLKDMEVAYPIRSRGEGIRIGKKQEIKAVNGVSLQIGKGRTLGIVGESGSGKSSLALGIMGLTEKAKGEIQLLNIRLPLNLRKRDKEMLAKLQMVFQSLDDAFSPYLTVEEILSRPLRNLLDLDKTKARQQVGQLLEMVKLPAEYLHRYPNQLSGGEKQRVAIAQAFAVNPDLLIADEPVSALDVSIQANILALLSELQSERQTAALLISHDIGVVTYYADAIGVFYRGQFMELSDSEKLLVPPFHPYTAGLLFSAAKTDPSNKPQAVRLEGDLPNPLEKPAGCPFHTQCPQMIDPLCKQEPPPWQMTPEGKRILCHIPLNELEESQKGIRFDTLGEEG